MKENKTTWTFKVLSLSLIFGVLGSFHANALDTKEGNLIIQGSACIGSDCNYGELFSTPPLKLKENNLRIKIQGEDLPTETERSWGDDYYFEADLGNSWNVNVNDTENGGDSYFSIEQSLSLKSDYYSDGTAINYDCHVNASTGYYEHSEVGVLTKGERWENKEGCQDHVNDLYLWSSSFLIKNGMKLGYDSVKSGGVAFGFGAEPVESTVAVGTSSELHRLVNVANAVDGVDAINISQMNVFSDKVEYLKELTTQLDELEIQLSILENRKNSNGGGISYLFLAILGLVCFHRIKISLTTTDQNIH